jgi:hypothetical protein
MLSAANSINGLTVESAENAKRPFRLLSSRFPVLASRVDASVAERRESVAAGQGGAELDWSGIPPSTGLAGLVRALAFLVWMLITFMYDGEFVYHKPETLSGCSLSLPGP